MFDGIKKYFKKCTHPNVHKQIGTDEYVMEVYIWEKDNPEPVEHYYAGLRCPDCGHPIDVPCWVD